MSPSDRSSMISAAMRERFLEVLSAYVRAWARHGIHFGFRSWQMPLWEQAPAEGGAVGAGGSVQTDYMRLFATTCLEMDASRLPSRSVTERMTAAITPGFGLAVALSGGPMVYRFPFSCPRPEKRGERNAGFLDAALFREQVLPALAPLEPHLRVLLLCLSPIYATEELSFERFLGHLEGFLGGLPSSHRYALAIRNREYLLPDYFACLRRHGVAHVFDDAAMPPLLEQIQIPGALAVSPVVYRSGGACGRVDGERLLGIVEMIRRSLEEQRSCVLYLDEAFTAASLEELMLLLNADLAKRSPIKQGAGAPQAEQPRAA